MTKYRPVVPFEIQLTLPNANTDEVDSAYCLEGEPCGAVGRKAGEGTCQ